MKVNTVDQHPKVVAAIHEQAARLTTIAPTHATKTRACAAQLVLNRAPDTFEKVFFTNGRTGANKNAIRMARLFTGNEKIVSRYRSYRGDTGAVIAATSDWRRMLRH